MSEQDPPVTDRDLQGDQDPDEAETRPDEEEGAGTTPEGRTDREQDDRGTTPTG